MSRFFANNRRDGARLLSSAILVLVIASTQFHYFLGQVAIALVMAICLYWSFQYHRLR